MNFHVFSKAHLMSRLMAVVSMDQIAGLATQTFSATTKSGSF